MVLSARRAASERRRPLDAGSRGGREPTPQAARVVAPAAKHPIPKWQQLHKSEVPRFRGLGTVFWVLLPSLWPPLGVWRRWERERRARPPSPNPRWDPALRPPKRCPCSGPSRPRRRGRGRGRDRALAARLLCSRRPSHLGRRRAEGRAHAGCARGSCSATDWRCPAGRLEGAHVTAGPEPPRPARGRERPCPRPGASSACAAPAGSVGRPPPRCGRDPAGRSNRPGRHPGP